MNKLVKFALFLKPYHKVLYLLALLLVANMARALWSVSHPNDFVAMWHLLALAWLALLNLMLHVFTGVVETKQKNMSLWARIKSKLQHGLMLFLSFIFIGITLAVILLSLRMWRIY